MAKIRTSKATLTSDRKLRALEAELDKVTERFRLAKLAVREAKVVAKAAKKEAKRARKELAAAQEQHEAAMAATRKIKAAPRTHIKAKASVAPVANPKRRIADSPEKVRRPQRKRKGAQVDASVPVARAVADPQTSELNAPADAGLPRAQETADPVPENGKT